MAQVTTPYGKTEGFYGITPTLYRPRAVVVPFSFTEAGVTHRPLYRMARFEYASAITHGNGLPWNLQTLLTSSRAKELMGV